jgi:hypothetical protein
VAEPRNSLDATAPDPDKASNVPSAGVRAEDWRPYLHNTTPNDYYVGSFPPALHHRSAKHVVRRTHRSDRVAVRSNRDDNCSWVSPLRRQSRPSAPCPQLTASFAERGVSFQQQPRRFVSAPKSAASIMTSEFSRRHGAFDADLAACPVRRLQKTIDSMGHSPL